MWKSVSIHILKNTQANKPYGTEDRQVRKTLKSAKFVKSAIQTKQLPTTLTQTAPSYIALRWSADIRRYRLLFSLRSNIAPLEQRALFATFL